MHLWHICTDTHPCNNLEHCLLKFSCATLSRTPHSPKLLLLHYGLSRGKVVLAAVVVLLQMAMLIMMMMTYLSYYSFSARGWATQRHIPSDDEFISVEDEMSCQGHGYVWDVICVLWSTVLDQTCDRPGQLAVNLPALLAQDLPPLVPRLCLYSLPPVARPILLHQSHNAWKLPTGGIGVLSESRGKLGWLCITSLVATLYAQSLLRCKIQPHLQRNSSRIHHNPWLI